MKNFSACIAAALMVLAAPVGVLAQSGSVELMPGEVIYDGDGGTVGKVVSIKDDAAVIDTGATKVTLGISSFRRRDGKLTLPMNRAALEAAAAKVQSEGDEAVAAAMTPGGQFFDDEGVAVGTIVSVEGKQVTVKTGEITASVPLSAFVKGPKGPAIQSTAAEFMAALEAQRPKASTSANDRDAD